MTTDNDATARIRELMALDKTAIPADGGERFNRLIFEASPYLLQHAENPVDWYPWGEEAFAAARRDDKPLFLSIGYATCHWCHVMAHESFEDTEVAAVINRNFVPVKVDREERPDIDDQYMLVSQMMTGGGGWPLNILMTPERQPFLAVTYLPRSPRMGMPGIIEALENIATLWRSRRDLVLNNCAAVMEGIARQTARPPDADPQECLPDAAWEQLRRMYDPDQGGFGSVPKFPMPHFISYLVLYACRRDVAEPLRMAGHTLEMLRRGGICDQLGYGFHRYATDRRWLIPHFEKMLYDQALIGDACLAVFRATGDGRWLRMAGEIASFALDELSAPEGGFYAALDADSEGGEGRFYLWTPAELQNVLGEEDAGLFCRIFGVTAEGNFEGENILHLERPLEECAAGEGLSPATLCGLLERWRSLLMAVRGRRPRPLRDEKILTAWNGLMIAFLGQAYAVSGEPGYRAAATRAADFILSNLVTPAGRLIRSWHAGSGGPPAFLEDYACLVRGLIELHQATLEERFLDEALRFNDEMLRLFRDPVEGALFDTANDAEAVLVRMKNSYDGATPSGNGMAALNLVRLGRIAGDERLLREGEAIVVAFRGTVARQPVNHLQFLTAEDLLDNDVVEVTFAGAWGGAEVGGMLRALHRRYLPGLTVRFSGEAGGERAQAVVCAGGACRPPVTGAEELERMLAEVVTPAVGSGYSDA